MTTVTRDNAHETNVHRWTTEASDLGLPPGEWPDQLPTTLGNGQPFIATHREFLCGVLLWVSYAQALGCISLRVFND